MADLMKQSLYNGLKKEGLGLYDIKAYSSCQSHQKGIFIYQQLRKICSKTLM